MGHLQNPEKRLLVWRLYKYQDHWGHQLRVDLRPHHRPQDQQHQHQEVNSRTADQAKHLLLGHLKGRCMLIPAVRQLMITVIM